MSRWNHYYNNNNECFENDRINNRQKDCDDDNRAYECSCLNDPCEDEYSCECEYSKCPPEPQGLPVQEVRKTRPEGCLIMPISMH